MPHTKKTTYNSPFLYKTNFIVFYLVFLCRTLHKTVHPAEKFHFGFYSCMNTRLLRIITIRFNFNACSISSPVHKVCTHEIQVFDLSSLCACTPDISRNLLYFLKSGLGCVQSGTQPFHICFIQNSVKSATTSCDTKIQRRTNGLRTYADVLTASFICTQIVSK